MNKWQVTRVETAAELEKKLNTLEALGWMVFSVLVVTLDSGAGVPVGGFEIVSHWGKVT